MKRRIFKFGAALTAALMVFSATASMAFATGVDEVVDTDTVIEATVDETAAEEATEEEAAEEADVEDVVVVEEEVALETAEITEGDVELAAKVDDVNTGSVISIKDISATKAEGYYNVSVPFELAIGASAPSQLSFFVYDITKIDGDQNNTVGFSSTTTTPVGYINQYAGAASGSYSFKLSAADYDENSIIVVKIGGTGIATPDAKSYKLGEAPDVLYGDANKDATVNYLDARLIMQYELDPTNQNILGQIDLKAADAYNDGTVNYKDARVILQYELDPTNPDRKLPITPAD